MSSNGGNAMTQGGDDHQPGGDDHPLIERFGKMKTPKQMLAFVTVEYEKIWRQIKKEMPVMGKKQVDTENVDEYDKGCGDLSDDEEGDPEDRNFVAKRVVRVDRKTARAQEAIADKVAAELTGKRKRKDKKIFDPSEAVHKIPKKGDVEYSSPYVAMSALKVKMLAKINNTKFRRTPKDPTKLAQYRLGKKRFDRLFADLRVLEAIASKFMTDVERSMLRPVAQEAKPDRFRDGDYVQVFFRGILKKTFEVSGQGKTEKGDETIILFLEGGPDEFGKILKLVATIEGVKYVRRNKCTSRMEPTPTIEFPVKGYWTIKTVEDQNDDLSDVNSEDLDEEDDESSDSKSESESETQDECDDMSESEEESDKESDYGSPAATSRPAASRPAAAAASGPAADAPREVVDFQGSKETLAKMLPAMTEAQAYHLVKCFENLIRAESDEEAPLAIRLAK
jgi:hypothetical protein